ncbi:MAG TPA: MbeD/MobD family mobilization/exclusion protein [Patescibacteria group bacterium]|nr:MbeD/MobD family mobilization/exclusion protein [Patescibacteria group bacterium]
MTKYQQTFQDMLDYHTDLFSAFEKMHSLYEKDSKKWQKEFNDLGEEVLGVIRKYENILCNTSESGKYGKFSSNLSDKFWEVIRAKFPKIDFIGIH